MKVWWFSNLEFWKLIIWSKPQNSNLKINNYFKEIVLDRNSTVKEYLIVRRKGKLEVKRMIKFPLSKLFFTLSSLGL